MKASFNRKHEPKSPELGDLLLWGETCLKYKGVVSQKVVFLLGFHRTSNSSISMVIHNCQPLLGVNLSPEFVNLYFPYAGRGLLFFRWWQQHFEFQLACVAMEGRSNVVRNTHA